MGVANLVRDCVREYALIAKPLHAMLGNYTKSQARLKVLQWTEESSVAFDVLRERIHECPLLFFMDDVSPIFLYTDASIIGIGAHLVQVVEGHERTIGMISKAFDSTLAKWHTCEQEGFAIFYALNKWEYLLRDRRFTVRTDHDNLRQLKQEYGHIKRVQRLFMCFQSFDIVFEHLPGEMNVVADALSRVCGVDASDKIDDNLCSSLERCLEEESHTEDQRISNHLWEAIKACHNSVVGHHGVERTMGKLRRSNNNWKNMRQHVIRFIKCCVCCQQMSTIKLDVGSAFSSI